MWNYFYFASFLWRPILPLIKPLDIKKEFERKTSQFHSTFHGITDQGTFKTFDHVFSFLQQFLRPVRTLTILQIYTNRQKYFVKSERRHTVNINQKVSIKAS